MAPRWRYWPRGRYEPGRLLRGDEGGPVRDCTKASQTRTLRKAGGTCSGASDTLKRFPTPRPLRLRLDLIRPLPNLTSALKLMFSDADISMTFFSVVPLQGSDISGD